MAITTSLSLKSYQTLVNSMGIGILLLDSKQKIVHWNRWYAARSKLDIQNCKNNYFADVFPELDPSRIEEAIVSALELGYPSIVSNVFSRSPFPLFYLSNLPNATSESKRIQQAINVRRIIFDNENYCLIQINDVTASVIREKNLEKQVQERKIIENALLKSEIRHSSIMETMIDGLIIFCRDGTIESINPAAENIFSIRKNRTIGSNINRLIEGFREFTSSESELKNKKSTIVAGKSRECIAIRNDGCLFPIELSISKIPLENDTLYSAVIRDITERKKTEKMKQAFIATVNHELRTPLTSIRGSLGLLSGGVISDIPKKAADLIAISNKNCERLILLINDILDMEKITSGALDISFSDHNINKLLQQAISSNEAYGKLFGVKFIYTDNDSQCRIKVDEHRFQQIMSNLLSNAAKFSQEANEVNIHVNTSSDFVEINIKDKGPGIPEEFRDNIWNKFSQADNSNTRELGGTGLGLAISKSLTEAMHGKLSFTTKTDEGTVFHLRFPNRR